MGLFDHSIEVILHNQDKSGAYVACPNFPTYHFCWLRDGSFIAYSMDRVNQHESAERFYRWVGTTIERYSGKVDVLAEQLKAGKTPDNDGILNTRFTLNGLEENSESQWGNFQVDGYGSWLWGLAEHVRLTGNYALLAVLKEPILTTLRYLKLVWQLPNYDCWEEHPEYLHPYSLATTYGGLDAMSKLKKSGHLDFCDLDVEGFAQQVKQFLMDHAIFDGKFVKHIAPAKATKAFSPLTQSGVDSSLLGLVIPYGAFDLNDPVVLQTVAAIEKDLHLPGGGVYRYKEDVYYGGGEWILLTAWLGWYYAMVGNTAKARDLLQWIERVADKKGDLPEQVSEHVLSARNIELWVKEWGPIATPLLWSHAMHIVLVKAIEEGDK